MAIGKISIDRQLSPGGIYKLPVLPVINTGDEKAVYEVKTVYLYNQKEQKPSVGWFTFSPQRFSLDSGKAQNVNITLTLPVNVKPGNYFVFLQAQPVIAAGKGVTIGVAAATKLDFKVKSSGVLGAAIERLKNILESQGPTFYAILVILALVLIIIIAGRLLDIKIGFRKKQGKKQK